MKFLSSWLNQEHFAFHISSLALIGSHPRRLSRLLQLPGNRRQAGLILDILREVA
jgi:hypothetical protein